LWLGAFLDTAATLLGRMRDGARSRDRKGVKDIAHQFAGPSLAVGAMVLGGLCRDLMDAALVAGDAEIARRVDAIAAAFAAAQADIAAFLAAQRESVA
jgi:HPt (histidine-containing phosphotransfer) domain-containing protein